MSVGDDLETLKGRGYSLFEDLSEISYSSCILLLMTDRDGSD